MTTKPSRLCLVAVLAVSLVVGAACGGGSKLPPAAEDKAKAERMVLTLADVPEMTQDPPDEDEADGSFADECAGNNPTLTADPKPRGAEAPQFSKDDGEVLVSSGAFFTETETEARKAFDDLETALGSQCLKDGIKGAVEEGAEGHVTVANVSASPLPEVGGVDESRASRVSLDLTADGERTSLHFDIQFLRHGRVLAGLFTVAAGAPFPDAERRRLSTLLARRVSGKAQNDGPPATVAPTPSTRPSAGSSASTTPQASGRATRYRDPSGVTFEHPGTWTVQPAGKDPLVVFIDPSRGVPFRRNVNILRQVPEEPLTLDEYTAISLQRIREANGTVERQSATTLSGLPAHRMFVRADLGQGDLRFLSVWTIRGGTAWVVTYTADPARFDQALPEVERMLTTIGLPA